MPSLFFFWSRRAGGRQLAVFAETLTMELYCHHADVVLNQIAQLLRYREDFRFIQVHSVKKLSRPRLWTGPLFLVSVSPGVLGKGLMLTWKQIYPWWKRPEQPATFLKLWSGTLVAEALSLAGLNLLSVLFLYFTFSLCSVRNRLSESVTRQLPNSVDLFVLAAFTESRLPRNLM